jgi:outer membrane autotransporter protein
MNANQVFDRHILVSLLLSVWLIPQIAAGGVDTLYWDIPTGGPSGSWDTGTANWSPNVAGGAQTFWASGSSAVFSATGLGATGDFTVTLAEDVVAADLTFTGGILNSTLKLAVGAGDAITMGNPQMIVTVDFGTTLDIAPSIVGGGALTLQNGTLILTGANTYSGGTTILAGTLQLGNESATGSIGGTVVNDDTFNIVNENTLGITTITNNSGGTTNFLNASTAGTATITNTGGFTNFMNTSTAGTANITNDSGFTQFFDTATAGTATITNANGGVTEFFDKSTAGTAAITNNSDSETEFFNTSMAGGAIITTFSGGFTEFLDQSTAGNAIIMTNFGGETDFRSTSTAVNAKITNNGGLTRFFDTSTAGNAIITNFSGDVPANSILALGALPSSRISDGTTQFLDASTAGNATITNNSGGITFFQNASTADRSVITNNQDGDTVFMDASTSGNASTTNNSGGVTFFVNASTAANATITNNPGGTTFFENASTGANATITNYSDGFTEFLNTSTAGAAAITTNAHGIAAFVDTSTAANATLITNAGGETIFADASSGGQARFITNAGGIVDISRLSSTGTTAGSIEGAGEYFLGSKTFTVGLNNLSTLVSGIIADGSAAIVEISPLMAESPLTTESPSTVGGSLIKVGTGTLTLTGPNTYTGGTTFNGGILAVNNDGDLGTGPLRFGGGTLEALASGGGITSSKAITLNAGGGTFLADTGTTSILSATISGLGSFTKNGTGILVLSGSNAYSGGTSLNGGILAVNSDANLGTGPLSFNGGTLEALAAGGGVTSTKAIALETLGGRFLADAATTTSTLSGAISGTGSLTKDGPGTLLLSGANTYTGGTVLRAGTLTVKGTQALGLGDVVVNGGILNADPQSINVRGNYVQNTGGTLQLQVAGANPGQYDSLNVGGNASLGGTLQLISLGFQPKTGDQLTLITTGRGVSGRFAQLVDPFLTGPGFTFTGLVYEPNSVLLEFRTAASFALTPNQLAAGNLVDAVHLDPRAANLISFLNQEPFANLPGDFERISPDGLTAFYEISFSNANIQRLNLESRLDDLHYGSSGFSSNMRVNGGATVNLEDRADADGKSSKAVVEPILKPGPENRWGVWMTGFGDFVSVNSDANANGYDFTTGGVSLGVDYRITNQLAIGVMAEYSHTWTSLQPSGNIDVNSGRGGLYATWYDRGIYLNAAIYGGYNNYDSSRSGLGGLATGSTGGAEMSTFISGGYDFHFASLTVGPIAALQYTYSNVNGFSENGSLAPMQIQSNSADSLRSDVGFRVFYQWQIGKVLVEPSLKAAWEHEYLYSALPVTASFAEIPSPTATFFGPSEGHDSAIISAGASAQWSPAMTIYLNYDGQLARGNYDSNAVTGGVRIGF